MKQITIYEIRCLVNNRVYVGSATSFRHRKGHHLWHLARGSHHSKLLQLDWVEHGSSAFQFNILEVCSESDRYTRETHYISKLEACAEGYNTIPDASVLIPPNVMTPERKAYMQSEEYRKEHSEWMKTAIAEGRVPKRPWTEKLSNSSRQRMIKMNKSRVYTPERRKAISEMLVKRNKDPAFIAKVSESNKGKKRNYTDEQKPNLRKRVDSAILLAPQPEELNHDPTRDRRRLSRPYHEGV